MQNYIKRIKELENRLETIMNESMSMEKLSIMVEINNLYLKILVEGKAEGKAAI